MQRHFMAHIGDLDPFHPDQVAITRVLSEEGLRYAVGNMTGCSMAAQNILSKAGPLELWQRVAHELWLKGQKALPGDEEGQSYASMGELIFHHVQFIQNMLKQMRERDSTVPPGHPGYAGAQERLKEYERE